jgi:hypothetical protein
MATRKLQSLRLGVRLNLLKKRASRLISLLILILLLLHATTTFKVFGLCLPEDLFPSFSSYRLVCSPSLWPIIEYALYSFPHYEGEKLDHPIIFGVFSDFTEVRIHPADLGLTFSRSSYRQGLVDAFQQATAEHLRRYVNWYERRSFKKVIAIRLENHPVVLTKTGVKLDRVEVLKIIRVNSLRENM